MWRKGIRKFSLMTIHVFWAGYLQKIHCDICSDGMLAFGWTEVDMELWSMLTFADWQNTDLTQRGNESPSKKCLFRTRVRKACLWNLQKFGQLCRSTKREWIIRLLPLTIEQTKANQERGEKLSFGQKKEIAMFSIEPVCSKSLLQQIH